MTNPTASARNRSIAYWVTTVIIAAELALGGCGTFCGLTTSARFWARLGYPAYFSVIIGLWKVPGAVVLLVPRLPRLKEWAYAGAVFTYTERPPPTWRWVTAPARWARLASPSSRSPPGRCVPLLAGDLASPSGPGSSARVRSSQAGSSR